jgi:hypothetical protein
MEANEKETTEQKKGLMKRRVGIGKFTLPLWLALIAGCCILSLGVYVAGTPESAEAPELASTSESADASEPTNTPEPTKTQVPLAPSIEEMRVAADEMTDAQWKAWQSEQEGKRVDGWTGWVEDVNAKTLGGYELWVDMDSPDALLSTQDVQFDIEEERALEASKDDRVQFSGVVRRVTRAIGILVTLDDATWEIVD